MQNYKLTLCYDGTRYRGWQKQGNTAQTVQGKLETLLSRALEQPSRSRAAAARMPASTRECRCAPSWQKRTSPARSF